ncbi:MBL fold metallo-hydrolase [Alteromonas oceanisediminis]|uniref:MBL fold metallo-hydrolase n=1 Tax=Alteromonas oceanisediminis TaxID=2836180 RepID=UPI001BDB30E5|nr:MBL fold metallo-hydrolase [Alteromonas oceanisediminis]MBT0585750.1 MBL fold metallo-hydrolase [Alteromonas oceanisediminis]
MQITFYGVRGSIPTPGKEFVRYGGNTACVHVALNDGTDIILDAGTGIRLLGKKLLSKTTPVHVLLSHNHWDHIQGFPFFAPIFQPDREIFITPGIVHDGNTHAVLEQMNGSLFPVPASALASIIQITAKPVQTCQWACGDAVIKRMPINHPGGGVAYAIQTSNAKVVYLTDNELYPPYKKSSDFLTFVEFCRDADLLIHDAQYMLSDMPAKSGWGHSVAEEAVKLAMASNSKQLALYSHDPERTDNDVDAIIEHCKIFIEAAGSPLSIFASAEEQSLSLPNH